MARKEVPLSLRVEEADLAALNDIAGRINTVSKAQVMRAALRLGILALREDPGRVIVPPPAVDAPAPAAKPARARKGRRET